METLRLDKRGRITIPARQRRLLSGTVVAISMPHGVLLRPVNDMLEHGNNLPDSLRNDGDGAAAAEPGP